METVPVRLNVAAGHCQGTLFARVTARTLLVWGAILISSCAATVPHTHVRGGPVLAVGGGGTPTEAVTVALELAAPAQGDVTVVVIPHASQRENRGVASVAMWRDAGAGDAVLLDDNPAIARDQIQRADVVWMGGGSQTRLMEHLDGANLADEIRLAHRRGALVGGTSAGAAVLGEFMIAGAPAPSSYRAGAMASAPGLGLIPGVIVDQHFAERKREGRLLTAIMDQPGTLGIGVSEATGALVEGTRLTVIGKSTVALFDGRSAKVRRQDPGGLRAASGIDLSIVPTGSEWHIGR